MSVKPHLLGLSRPELEELSAGFGEPKYRATQVFKALHQRRLRTLDEITDLPKKFRGKLNEMTDVSRLSSRKDVSVEGHAVT